MNHLICTFAAAFGGLLFDYETVIIYGSMLYAVVVMTSCWDKSPEKNAPGFPITVCEWLNGKD